MLRNLLLINWGKSIPVAFVRRVVNVNLLVRRVKNRFRIVKFILLGEHSSLVITEVEKAFLIFYGAVRETYKNVY